MNKRKYYTQQSLCSYVNLTHKRLCKQVHIYEFTEDILYHIAIRLCALYNREYLDTHSSWRARLMFLEQLLLYRIICQVFNRAISAHLSINGMPLRIQLSALQGRLEIYYTHRKKTESGDRFACLFHPENDWKEWHEMMFLNERLYCLDCAERIKGEKPFAKLKRRRKAYMVHEKPISVRTLVLYKKTP